MAIRLEFNSDSLFSKLSLYIRQADAYLAFEACTILLRQLQQTTLRLEDKLLAFNRNKVLFEIDSSVSDVWEIIEISHRIFKLYPLLFGSPISNTALQNLVYKVSSLHDSLQNLPALINHYYSKPGNAESVLGDFQWGYREKLEDEVTQCLVKGSYTRPGVKRSININSASLFSTGSLHRFDGHLGVFGIEFKYVIRTQSPESNNVVTLENTELMIDDIIDAFNRAIVQLEIPQSRLIAQQLRSDPELSPDTTEANIGPSIIVISPAGNDTPQ